MGGALVAALFLGNIHPTVAAVIRWSFEDVWFDDGTPVVGSFDYEPQTGEVPWWDIRTFKSLYNNAQGSTYHSSYIGTHASLGPDLFGSASLDLDHYSGLQFLHFQFMNPIADVADPANELIITWGYELNDDGPGVDFLREIVEGGRAVAINPIPVPPSCLLLGTGLIGLGWFKFRRRKK